MFWKIWAKYPQVFVYMFRWPLEVWSLVRNKALISGTDKARMRIYISTSYHHDSIYQCHQYSYDVHHGILWLLNTICHVICRVQCHSTSIAACRLPMQGLWVYFRNIHEIAWSFAFLKNDNNALEPIHLFSAANLALVEFPLTNALNENIPSCY